MSVRRDRRAALVALVTAAVAPATVRADEYEAQWSARPFGGVAAVAEDGAGRQITPLGGVSVGVTYGISNRLDLGGEILALRTTKSTFTGTMVIDGGRPYHGPLQRETASTLAMFGPTWRLGVSWVPVLTLAAGGGARFRSAGTFSDLGLTLDDKRATTTFDLAGLARVGIERRVQRRLTLGLYAQGLATWGPSVSLLPIASVSLGLSYVHYHVASPRWRSTAMTK